ncbi:rhomboid family intramembrane serine protease [Gangjinia marincola]|uniref:Rhomboid family intramembrane serine protease n=1 Tax=Gangjinia marincola TaxID=578463 RepID=A0ABP3XSE3_9FLAO
MGDIEIVTLVIIAANVIASFKGFNDPSFFSNYKFHVGSIRSGQQIRMLTSGFLHVDTSHLLVNMLTLYFFANQVIYGVGAVGFLIIYLGSLILGNILSLYFHKDEYEYHAVGASGAVMGILYAAILLQPDMMLLLFFIVPIPAYVFGIGYLLYSIYGMRARTDNVGHDAHFGGAVAGYLITLILAPWIFSSHRLMVVLLAIPIVVLFVMKKLNKI